MLHDIEAKPNVFSQTVTLGARVLHLVQPAPSLVVLELDSSRSIER